MYGIGEGGGGVKAITRTASAVKNVKKTVAYSRNKFFYLQTKQKKLHHIYVHRELIYFPQSRAFLFQCNEAIKTRVDKQTENV